MKKGAAEYIHGVVIRGPQLWFLLPCKLLQVVANLPKGRADQRTSSRGGGISVLSLSLTASSCVQFGKGMSRPMPLGPCNFFKTFA